MVTTSSGPRLMRPVLVRWPGRSPVGDGFALVRVAGRQRADGRKLWLRSGLAGTGGSLRASWTGMCRCRGGCGTCWPRSGPGTRQGSGSTCEPQPGRRSCRGGRIRNGGSCCWSSQRTVGLLRISANLGRFRWVLLRQYLDCSCVLGCCLSMELGGLGIPGDELTPLAVAVAGGAVCEDL